MRPQTIRYHDHKIYHKAASVNAAGHVSALCFKRPRAIDRARASWTLVDKLVTCPKCLAVLAQAKLNTYRCGQCGKIVKRESTKRWIKSYCDATGKNARLMLQDY